MRAEVELAREHNTCGFLYPKKGLCNAEAPYFLSSVQGELPSWRCKKHLIQQLDYILNCPNKSYDSTISS